MSVFFLTFIATVFTFSMTAAGSAMVFFFKAEIPDWLHRLFLGFASGVMIAASIWSLLIPSMEQALQLGLLEWLPAAGGFLSGGLFLLLLERYFLKISPEKTAFLQTTPLLARNLLLIFAITMHNIPEGMAVGLAWPIALGIGIQNFPEGAAVALPLRKSGLSRSKAFLLGSSTGLVEPIFGLLTLLLAKQITILMPWLLAFAAGAMIYVVVEELIPEAHDETHSVTSILGFIIGFLLMMILDVSLG